MALNRSQLEEACYAGSKERINLLLASDTRLPKEDGRAFFLKIIGAITDNVPFRNALLDTFVNHFKARKEITLSQQTSALYSFLILAVNYDNSGVIFKLCEKLYANQRMYWKMKKLSAPNDFFTIMGEANRIYSGLLLERAANLVKKFENSYFYKPYDEALVSATISLINDYFELSHSKYNPALFIARNKLMKCEYQLSPKNNRTRPSQYHSTWEQLTNLNRGLYFSIFRSPAELAEEEAEFVHAPPAQLTKR